MTDMGAERFEVTLLKHPNDQVRVDSVERVGDDYVFKAVMPQYRLAVTRHQMIAFEFPKAAPTTKEDVE